MMLEPVNVPHKVYSHDEGGMEDLLINDITFARNNGYVGFEDYEKVLNALKEWKRLYDMNEIQPHYSADLHVMHKVIALTLIADVQ